MRWRYKTHKTTVSIKIRVSINSYRQTRQWQDYKDTYYKKFDKVFIFSNSLHTITDKIKLKKNQCFNGISELESIIEMFQENAKDEDTKDIKNLLILDDVITDLGHEGDYLEKLFFNRRHCNVSIIITSQIFNKIEPRFRKGLDILFLFSTSNKQELQSIYINSIPTLSYKQFIEVTKYSFKTSHDFLTINTSDNSFYHNFNKLELKFDDEVDI